MPMPMVGNAGPTMAQESLPDLPPYDEWRMRAGIKTLGVIVYAWSALLGAALLLKGFDSVLLGCSLLTVVFWVGYLVLTRNTPSPATFYAVTWCMTTDFFFLRTMEVPAHHYHLTLTSTVPWHSFSCTWRCPIQPHSCPLPQTSHDILLMASMIFVANPVIFVQHQLRCFTLCQ